jgi:alkylation response protein AidB-like acyl-CoA dehydrogenase
MNDYRPPVRDIRFTLSHLVDLEGMLATGAFPDADPETVSGVVDEAGRFVSEVVAPLAAAADAQGSVRHPDGGVTTPTGYRDAYRKLVEAGWPAVTFPQEWGGGGFPFVVGLAIGEMLTSADTAFSLCPMLTHAADELLLAHGSPEQKATWLPRLVSGEWAGTMLLTESQAGSDVGALTARAVPADDGTYRITGTKIFVTWGEHDLTPNIVHVTLARVPGSPPGYRGISCFLVPKYLVGPDGSLGERNDVNCVSIEEKLGIHASPTCVLSFGDAGGAVAHLIGEENQGLRYMFTMMNNARLHVGVQGLAIAERAYQQARAYSFERRQGRATGAPAGESSPIVEHPDVRRMLMLMRSQIEAMRGVMYKAGEAIDLSNHHPDPERRRQAAAAAAILTPVAKAWGSDLGVEVASLGIQIHGGAGYINETGAAQWWRDARIASIYEGTNGIQAIDLVTRKLLLDGGAAVSALITEMRRIAAELGDAEALAPIGAGLGRAVSALEQATSYLAEKRDSDDALAGATPYTRMFGITAGGWMHGAAALAAARLLAERDDRFLQARLATARFYADHILPEVPGLLATVTAGAAGIFAIPSDAL